MSIKPVITPEQDIIFYTLVVHSGDSGEALITDNNTASIVSALDDLGIQAKAYSLSVSVNNKRIFNEYKFHPTILDNMLTASELAVETEITENE